jgi:hypothetical protein
LSFGIAIYERAPYYTNINSTKKVRIGEAGLVSVTGISFVVEAVHGGYILEEKIVFMAVEKAVYPVYTKRLSS